MKIEKLTDDERDYLVPPDSYSEVGDLGRKALRIIDQLTAALEAAERGWEQDVKAAEEAIQKKTKCVELAELSATAQRCAKEQAESRVAELEAQLSGLRASYTRGSAEAELADLRGRAERAIDAITSARLVTGSAEAAWAKTALEALSNA